MKNLIVVDMQQGFIRDTNKHLVEKINNYIKENSFDNIFFTVCVNNNDSPFTNILHWYGGTTDQEQQIIVNVPVGAKIIIKDGYGVSNDVVEMFHSMGITEMEVCGTDTDACCLAVAFNLFDNGIRPIVLSDLCASSSKETTAHTNAIELMKRQFGKDNVV